MILADGMCFIFILLSSMRIVFVACVVFRCSKAHTERKRHDISYSHT